MVTGHGQPEVVRHGLQALMEESEEDSLIRDQMKGMIMIHLKTLIDCLDA